MKRLATSLACLLACGPAGVVVAADDAAPQGAAVDVAANPAAAWTAFLAEADVASTYPAFDVLLDVGYSGDTVDAEQCATRAGSLAEAARLVPVSIAIRHAAMLCATATGDTALAERELAAVAALSRHALSQASHPHPGAPVQVLAPVDIYSLLRAAGLEYRYEFFEYLHPRRHFPLHVAAWDPEAGQERHLRFDFVDAAYAINDQDEFSGFPIQRKALADQFLKGLTEAGDETAADYGAVRAAAMKQAPEAKREVLVPAAVRGGIQAARTWLVLCVVNPFPGCTDGLVDALLPHAEQEYALPMVLLAVAYGEGIGVERDAGVARDLLKAADAQWPGMGGTVAYALLWTEMHDGPFPEALQAGLEAAWAAGNPDARLLALGHSAGIEGTVLDAAELSDLASPALNATRGQGYAQLAEYHRTRGDEAAALEWNRRAAAAGNTWEQAMLASHLLFGDDPVPADDPEVRHLLVEAANGGDIWAARRLASDSMRAGQWHDAKGWLLDAVGRGNIDALLEYAGMIVQDHPGLPGDPAQAIRIYRSLSDVDDVAAARRQLAELALEGVGMDKDPAQAREWLLVDARDGDHDSQARLGQAMLYGEFGAVEEAEGVRWLQAAIDAGHQEAMLGYGNWLYFSKDTAESRREGRALWERGHADDVLMASNNLAWVLCTAPRQDERDPARGLEVALAMEATHDLAPAQVDSVAACHAANGDYAAAVREQQQAIDDLRAIDFPEDDEAVQAEVEATLAGFDERLSLYRDGKPFIEVPAE